MRIFTHRDEIFKLVAQVFGQRWNALFDDFYKCVLFKARVRANLSEILSDSVLSSKPSYALQSQTNSRDLSGRRDFKITLVTSDERVPKRFDGKDSVKPAPEVSSVDVT